MRDDRMKCCYFPTTTVLIDDDPGFLKLAQMKIARFSPTKSFRDPVAALEYINHEYNKRPFFRNFFVNPEFDNPPINQLNFSIDFGKIYRQLYDPQRFSEITGLLVDYAMPSLNGRDFCKIALSSCDWRNWNNIILLTGEAKMETATEMMKDKLINGYIYKGDSGYLDKLIETIHNRQAEYFEKHSALFINLLADNADIEKVYPSCFKDPVYVNFFYKMVEKYNPTEYYLIDESGSYLFVSSEGKLSWLIMQSEDDMIAAEFEMGLEEHSPKEICKALKERKVVRYFFSEAPYPRVNSVAEWENYVYPAEKLEGRATYYYCFVENPKVESFVDLSRIVSYTDYRNRL